tara:strand:- start:2 stop:241 length:240 start_codon:yes stop_codon:yes gene_type:complete
MPITTGLHEQIKKAREYWKNKECYTGAYTIDVERGLTLLDYKDLVDLMVFGYIEQVNENIFSIKRDSYNYENDYYTQNY